MKDESARVKVKVKSRVTKYNDSQLTASANEPFEIVEHEHEFTGKEAADLVRQNQRQPERRVMKGSGE